MVITIAILESLLVILFQRLSVVIQRYMSVLICKSFEVFDPEQDL